MAASLECIDAACPAGTCSLAPLQWELVDTVLQHIGAPDVFALEQPPSAAAAGPVLPHPAWIEALLEHYDGDLPRSALDPSYAGARQGDASMLQQLLQPTGVDAAVGRDVMDPYEVGFCPGALCGPLAAFHIIGCVRTLPMNVTHSRKPEAQAWASAQQGLAALALCQHPRALPLAHARRYLDSTAPLIS